MVPVVGWLATYRCKECPSCVSAHAPKGRGSCEKRKGMEGNATNTWQVGTYTHTDTHRHTQTHTDTLTLQSCRRAKRLPQPGNEHWCGFSELWVIMWFFTSDRLKKAAVHPGNGHLNSWAITQEGERGGTCGFVQLIPCTAPDTHTHTHSHRQAHISACLLIHTLTPV